MFGLFESKKKKEQRIKKEELVYAKDTLMEETMNGRYKVFFDEQKRIFNLDFNYYLNILDINVKIKCEAWGRLPSTC